MKYNEINEASLKLKVSRDYFNDFDTTKIIGNIDYCVSINYKLTEETLFKDETDHWHDVLFWAEAKKGVADIYKSLTQLILTIGKARTFDQILPPPFLGAFDCEKISFIQWSSIHEIFYMNDFNWNVTPSNYDTKEFNLVYEMVKKTLENEYFLYYFEKDDSELKKFIKDNFKLQNENPSKVKITKNNFMIIYNKWLQIVKPTININWKMAKEKEIIDGDFYLADILSIENKSIKEKLYVLLNNDHYELDRKIDESGFFDSKKATFNDGQKAHKLFWNKYERPPKEEYWDYILKRRDLLVPQDVRERKGSYFTPQIWVELSQKYLADTLGENWQDEYYIWDCAAGTGNLLNGLTNKYNIWASTLDQQDVDVMKDRIKNGANLLESHIFQFDFLNDELNDVKVPKSLQDILSDPEKRKKLVIYINPPYAEHGNVSTKSETGVAKTGVATGSKTHQKFVKLVGTATRELFAQFFVRIFNDIPECKLATFAKMKYINSQNFIKFRQFFKATYRSGFMVEGNTFDNVKGKFPIGFLIWDLLNQNEITRVTVDVLDMKGLCIAQKSFYAFENGFISSWLRQYYDKSHENVIGHIILPGIDMQCQNGVYFTSQPTASDVKQHKTAVITKNNFSVMCIYFAVRHAITATWINDRDQFLYPMYGWEDDSEFKYNCIIFSLFHGQNRISSKYAINHWIPFSEEEISSQEKFESNFISNFFNATMRDYHPINLFDTINDQEESCDLSNAAQNVLSAGRDLWRYYHSIPGVNVNASLYDIKEYFQGRDESGKMRNKSDDEHYTYLIANLRQKLKELAKAIEPKVYEYGFLKK